MSKPICFMVMPFSVKETGLAGESAAPARVDFDALWERALAPAIEASGYSAVRADQDAGALIVGEMIQRLAMSDLVIADISVANANVYYEIGVRHAAQRYGCVLISASWARVLFDIQQMPRVVYTLDDGTVTGRAAARVRRQVEAGIAALAGGESPVYQAVPGFPDAAHDDLRISRFHDDVERMNEFLGRVRGVRRIASVAARSQAAIALRDEFDGREALRDGVAIELLWLLRDCVGWQQALEWIEAMPARLRARPAIEEQRLLAISKCGDAPRAIGALEQLIATAGDSSERQGLLGGRYKRLYDDAGDDDPARRVHLDRAIAHYERGMMLDLNDYYPSGNLPRLYRERGDVGDEERAGVAAAVALKACERARALDPGDPWVRPTLLGAAFDAHDVDGAEALAREVRVDSPAAWSLETTLADLRISVRQVDDPALRDRLGAVCEGLAALLPVAGDDRGPGRAAGAAPGAKTKAAKGGRAKKPRPARR